MDVRDAQAEEVDPLARLWYDAWQDGHAEIVPLELKRDRTVESLRERIRKSLPEVRVVGPPGEPLGFCTIRDDELYQLFVSAEARGTGVAAALISDAETRLQENGVETAWLACAIGNDRAQLPPHARDVPRRMADEMLQRLIRAGIVHALPHRAHRLPPTVAQQAEQIPAKGAALRDMRKAHLERLEPAAQAIEPRRRIARQSRLHRRAAYRSLPTSTRAFISFQLDPGANPWI